MIIFSIISFSIFVFTSGSVLSDKCSTEEKLTTLKGVAVNLKTLFNRNFEEGQKEIRKVLEEFDPSLTGKIKLTNESSFEEVLLQHQLILHQEMKEMFSEMKRLILGHKQTDYAISQIQKEVFLNDEAQNDSEMEKNSTMRNLDSRNQYERDAYPINENNIYISTDTTIRPSDCSDLLVAGYTESGVYNIYPLTCNCTKPAKVYCDMETKGGGWTIFLNRVNVSNLVNFTRNWQDYKNGFGTVGEEYWLGNEVLHIMTSSRNYTMRMEAQDGFGREVWVEYNSFFVNSEDNKYSLLVSEYNEKSSAYERSGYLSGIKFSTFDVDNDNWEDGSCSEKHKGGWWYNNCVNDHPTGIYGKESEDGIRLQPWSKSDDTIRYPKMLQLKIRPIVCSKHISAVQLNKHNCA